SRALSELRPPIEHLQTARAIELPLRSTSEDFSSAFDRLLLPARAAVPTLWSVAARRAPVLAAGRVTSRVVPRSNDALRSERATRRSADRSPSPPAAVACLRAVHPNNR